MMKARRCLKCNAMLEAVTGANCANNVSTENAVSICFYCGNIAMFQGEGLREPTSHEYELVARELASMLVGAREKQPSSTDAH